MHVFCIVVYVQNFFKNIIHKHDTFYMYSYVAEPLLILKGSMGSKKNMTHIKNYFSNYNVTIWPIFLSIYIKKKYIYTVHVSSYE